MPKLTPQQARQKQAERLKASTSLMTQGVQNVKVAPGKQAAAKSDKMLQNVQNAVTSGYWAQRVSAVSLEEWQDSFIRKGIPRVAAGIDAAAGKVERFFEEFFPFLETVEREVAQMPDLTLEDNINRMVHAIRRQSEFRVGKTRR